VVDHDLARLVELCESAGLLLPPALDDADRLTPYGIRFRYGSAVAGDVARAEAARWAGSALAWAREVVGRAS